MKCKIKGCSKKEHWTTKLCKTHQGRLLKYGDTYADIPIKAGWWDSFINTKKNLASQAGI